MIPNTKDKEITVVLYVIQYSKYFEARNYLMLPTNLRGRAYHYPHSTGERIDYETHCNPTASKQWSN